MADGAELSVGVQLVDLPYSIHLAHAEEPAEDVEAE